MSTSSTAADNKLETCPIHRNTGDVEDLDGSPSNNMCSIDLIIIVKSKLFGDFCYLGYHQDSKKVFRPMLKGHCDLEIGRTYRFNFNFSKQMDLLLPHGHNDLVVETFKRVKKRDELVWSPTIDVLLSFASEIFFDDILCHKSTVRDIFGNSKKTFKYYIEENTNMPSVGILVTRKVNIYQAQDGKHRIEICLLNRERNYELYDFPYTALHTPDPSAFLNPAFYKIVLFSMCRPYSGNEAKPFRPRRCYLLVAGLLLRNAVV